MRLPYILPFSFYKGRILQVILLVLQFVRPIFTLIIGYSGQVKFEIADLEACENITIKEFTEFLKKNRIDYLDLTHASVGELCRIPFEYFEDKAPIKTLKTIPENVFEALKEKTGNAWDLLSEISNSKAKKGCGNNKNKIVSSSDPLLICSDSNDPPSINCSLPMTFNPQKSRRPSAIQDDKAMSLNLSSNSISHSMPRVIFLRKDTLPTKKAKETDYGTFKSQSNNDGGDYDNVERFKPMAIDNNKDNEKEDNEDKETSSQDSNFWGLSSGSEDD